MAIGDLNTTRVVEITVDGRIDGQQIINKFYYRPQSPGIGGATAGNLLTNFRTAFRANMLNWMYNWFTIYRYTLREIADVRQVVPPVGPKRYVNVYSVDGYAILVGLVADKGALATPLDDRLPSHEAYRCFKAPSGRAFKFFKGNYNRFASFTVNEKDLTPEKWTAAFLAASNPSMSVFNLTSISAGVGVTPAYQHAVFSGGYYYTVVRPGVGGFIYQAATGIDAYIGDVYIGTQTTRRFTPAGSFTGK